MNLQNLLWNWVKICFELLKGSIFELQNCNMHQKKGHSHLHILHYCWKMCKIVIAHRKPKNAPHAHTSQVSKNGFARTHRNLLPHIATHNLLSHIASHALVSTVFWSSSRKRLVVRGSAQTEYQPRWLLLWFGKKNESQKEKCNCVIEKV